MSDPLDGDVEDIRPAQWGQGSVTALHSQRLHETAIVLRSVSTEPTPPPSPHTPNTALLPLAFTKRRPPVPSQVYTVLWHFAVERQRMYLRRAAGGQPPWTTDPILSTYKFTNAYRAADRVSQYLIRMIYSEEADPRTLFLRVLLFKIFNKIETWENIVAEFGLPAADNFDFGACDALLSRLRQGRLSIYSGAYIMPSGGKSGLPKHSMHLALVRHMLDYNLPAKLGATASLAETYRLLAAVPTFGPFLAFQYTIDLNYTTLMDHDEGEFVVAGPGALDGLSKCFDSLGDYSPEDTIRWLADIQELEFQRFDLKFDGLWGRRLQPIDVQNLFCEVSKYTRVSHPDAKGKSGRTRIKQKFKTKGQIPRPFFPPKWGLNPKIDAWYEGRINSDITSNEELRGAHQQTLLFG